MADVEGDMEVQGVGAVPGNLDVLGPGSEFLYGSGCVEGELVLTGADEDKYSKMLSIQPCERGRLDVLVVDQDVVGPHGVGCEA